MKYKAKDYARAIAQARKVNPQDFLRLLEKNGDGKKLKEIIILAEKMVLAKSGNKKITIETARATKSSTSVKNFGAVAGDVIEEKINPSLVAGIKIIIDSERQLDFSLKNKLEKIFHE